MRRCPPEVFSAPSAAFLGDLGGYAITAEFPRERPQRALSNLVPR